MLNMAIWEVVDGRLVKIEENLRIIVRNAPENTNEDVKFRILAIDVLSIIGVLRYLCQEKLRQEQSLQG